NDTSEFSNCVAVTGNPNTSVSLFSDTGSVPAGASTVALNAIPPSVFLNAPPDVNSAPVGSIPVGSIPVGSIPVGSIPVGSIPVGSIGFSAGQALLGSVALSTIPLVPPQSWAAILAGTTLQNQPLQNITLGQVLQIASTNSTLAGRLNSL